jgi:hypothetical protein
VQICTGSVIENVNAKIKDHLQGPEAYGVGLLDLEPKFSPSSFEERKINLENEKPFISYFEYADFMGYSTVSINAKNKVEMAIYRNWDSQAWKKFSVTDLFKS